MRIVSGLAPLKAWLRFQRYQSSYVFRKSESQVPEVPERAKVLTFVFLAVFRGEHARRERLASITALLRGYSGHDPIEVRQHRTYGVSRTLQPSAAGAATRMLSPVRPIASA